MKRPHKNRNSVIRKRTPLNTKKKKKKDTYEFIIDRVFNFFVGYFFLSNKGVKTEK